MYGIINHILYSILFFFKLILKGRLPLLAAACSCIVGLHLRVFFCCLLQAAFLLRQNPRSPFGFFRSVCWIRAKKAQTTHNIHLVIGSLEPTNTDTHMFGNFQRTNRGSHRRRNTQSTKKRKAIALTAGVPLHF